MTSLVLHQMPPAEASFSLRVLVLEQDPRDAERILQELQRASIGASARSFPLNRNLK